MSVNMTWATTTVTGDQYTIKRLTTKGVRGRPTAQEPIAVSTNGHLSKALAIGHDAEGHAKEELEALQEVGENASPVAKETEGDIALRTEKLSECLRIPLSVAHSHSFAPGILASQVQ